MADETVQMLIRVPESLRERMKRRAEASDRSLSAEVRVALTQYLEEPKRSVEPRFKR